MKRLIILISLLCTQVAWSQVETGADVEFYTQCLYDSISPSQIVYFTRVHSLSRPGSFVNKADDGSTYTPTGTVRSCQFQDVVKECWLKQQNVTYINYVYSIPTTTAYQTEDHWIVDWIYVEQKSVTSFANSQTPLFNTQRVPLAYPYGNSQREAERFTRDLKEWLDCMGICYKDDEPFITVATPTGIGSAYPGEYGLRVSVTVFGIEFVNMYYSRNIDDPGSYIIARAGSKTQVTNTACDQPFDLYRRVSTGHPAWGINYKGELELPPYTGLLTKVSCDFLDNRRDDCSRPSGSTEVWVSALDTPICNYYVSIPTNENIVGVYLRGVNVIGGTYMADNGGVSGKDVQDLTDTLNDYLHARNGYGEFAINNIQGTNYGWRITAKWLNYTFDSIKTTGNQAYTFIPTISGCAYHRSYFVQRNDLGGILHCKSELGKSVYLPDNAIRVAPGQENTIFDCQNRNRYGMEVVAPGSGSTSKTYDLSKFHYFSYTVINQGTNGVSVESKDQAGATNTLTAPTGYSDSFTAETDCDYMKGSIKITVTNPAIVKVSYLW